MIEAMEFGVKVLGMGTSYGLAVGVFVVLATSAIFAVVHTFKRVIT